MPEKTNQPKNASELSFEKAMQRLDEIVEQMEANKLPLEELLTGYEEGLRLVKLCSEKLDAAEKRIEIITRDATGKPQVTEFEPQKEPQKEPKQPASPSSPAPSRSEDISLF